MGRRRRKKNHYAYAPEARKNELESGTTVPMSKVPPEIKRNFPLDDPTDGGDNFPGSEFIDGVGDALDTAKVPELPLPSVAMATPGQQAPATETIDITHTRLPAPEPGHREEELVPVMSAPAPAPAVGDRRQHLTWIVTGVSIQHRRDEVGKLTADVKVTAMLAVVRFQTVATDVTPSSTREPAMQVTKLMEAPVDLNVPLWLFTPDQQRRPDMISLHEATQALTGMFANLAFEMIRAAPMPRSMAAVPQWLRAEMARSKGLKP